MALVLYLWSKRNGLVVLKVSSGFKTPWICLPYPLKFNTLLSSPLLWALGGSPVWSTSMDVLILWLPVGFDPTDSPSRRKEGTRKPRLGYFPFVPPSLWVHGRLAVSLDWRSWLPWNILFHTALSTQFPLQIPDYHSQLPPSGLKMEVTTPGHF